MHTHTSYQPKNNLQHNLKSVPYGSFISDPITKPSWYVQNLILILVTNQAQIQV